MRRAVWKKPFFLYLAHNAPHFPLQAPADEIARFRGKYKDGWDKLRISNATKSSSPWDCSTRPGPSPRALRRSRPGTA